MIKLAKVEIIEEIIEQDEEQEHVYEAAQTVTQGKQEKTRALCKPWDVKRYEKKANGKFGSRADAEIK